MAILASRGLLKYHLNRIVFVDLSPSIAVVVMYDIYKCDGGKKIYVSIFTLSSYNRDLGSRAVSAYLVFVSQL